MTTYSAIADNEIDVDSPATTGLFTKLRDNPLAIQEGDATAPIVQKAKGANLVHLETLDTTSQTTVSFTSNIDSTYDWYEFHIINVGADATADRGLTMQYSTDGGSTWKSTAADYSASGVTTASATIAHEDIVGSGVTNIGLEFVNDGNTENITNGVVVLYDPSNTTRSKGFEYRISCYRDNISSSPVANQRYKAGIGTQDGATQAVRIAAIDAIRFTHPDNSGTWDYGEIRLYGRRNEN